MSSCRTVQVTVNVYDLNYVPLASDIAISGVLNTDSVVAGTTLTSTQRVVDTLTITVDKTGYDQYSNSFKVYYGADGNLEPIVLNVIMFADASYVADIKTFLTNFCAPVTRVKTNIPSGDTYEFTVTMNRQAEWTADWEYPVATPVGTGVDIQIPLGAVGLKTVKHIVASVDDPLISCNANDVFVLQNLNVKVCYSQCLVEILDEDDNVMCSSPSCADPYDMSEGGFTCCNGGVEKTRKFVFVNNDDFDITIDPGCTPSMFSEIIGADAAVFQIFTIQDYNVVAGGQYEVHVQFLPNQDCTCGLKTAEIQIVAQQDANIGIGTCCSFTYGITGNIQNKELSLSDSGTVQLLAAVGDCVTGVITVSNDGCANLKLPTLTVVAEGSCLELNVPITYEYDPVQLAALPLDADGDPYLSPAPSSDPTSIDILVTYCPSVEQNGCCPIINVIGECNTEILTGCYNAVVPPSCLEFLILPCDKLKLSVPDSAETIDEEPAVECVTPGIDLRFSGNAFFPPCNLSGCDGFPCELVIEWENLTTGDTIAAQTFDPGTFNYSVTPTWEYTLQFPSAGIWQATVTARWCNTEETCTKKYTVCHDIAITRLKCHLRRININTPVAQNIIVVVESVYGTFSQNYSFNTSQQTYVDVTLPGDDAYRVTITFEADGTQKIVYIDEICGLAECYREMVLKIMCSDVADPCCTNCDPEEVEKRKKLRYMITQVMALFLSVTSLIHRDTMSYIGVWEDDDCRQASQQEIAELIEALKKAIMRCGVCDDSIASQITSSGCQNC